MSKQIIRLKRTHMSKITVLNKLLINNFGFIFISVNVKIVK